MLKKRSLIILPILFAGVIFSLYCTSCHLEKRISVTTGRYENSQSPYHRQSIEFETARDTIASYRF